MRSLGLLRAFVALLGLLFVLAPAAAQPEGVLQLDDELHTFLERQQARGLLPRAHLTHRPLSAYEAERYLDSLDAYRPALTDVDRRLLDRFQGRTTGPGVRFVQRYAPYLYGNGEDFFVAEGEDYAVQIEPLFYFSYGRARQSERENREQNVPVWQNTRGIRLGGHIGDYVFFETRLTENQRRDPDALRPPYEQKTAPRLANTRFPGDNTYDYFQATGIVGVRSKHFEVRFGRDRNHWGPGETSLLLSDYAPAYDQLQIRTSFWRVQYTNVFASMTDLTPLPIQFTSQNLPKKFASLHRLAINLPGHVKLGLFESVIFAAKEDGQTRFGFELAYLNPLIFYRSVERDLGSPDNVLLGADIAWKSPLEAVEFYGQFLLDELVVENVFTNSWTNKHGLLLGAKWIPPLENQYLSVSLEYARLRPYLYTHRDPSTSYTHYNDLLGHPAGPNAEDFALFARYQPAPRIEFALNAAYARRGRAPANTTTIGADPLVSYNLRDTDDAPLLDGIRQQQAVLEARSIYELLPQLSLGLSLRYRHTNDEIQGLDRYLTPSLLLQWGLPFRSTRY